MFVRRFATACAPLLLGVGSVQCGREVASSQAGSGPATASTAPREVAASSLRVFVFSATKEYRHASIEPAVLALRSLATEHGWSLRAGESASDFHDDALVEFDVVVFLSTTGDVLDVEQQAAFERFIRAGHGYVGVHSASDTEYDWPWYGGLVGAYFSAHPAIQRATLQVEAPEHPALAALPATWIRTDEWYGFRSNPRGDVTVLLALDESSYAAGDSAMGADHPVAWAHEYDGGRAFYTALGHTTESYSEPEFLAHLASGIEWAGGR